MDCKSNTSTTPICGEATLFARSYTLPPRWPLPPIHLVMETRPASCDFYRSTQVCCDLIMTPERYVERPVREALVSFLAGCGTPARPTCRAADFGGNNGWMSLYMLALGAHTTTVEPASDFAGKSAMRHLWAPGTSPRPRSHPSTPQPHNPRRNLGRRSAQLLVTPAPDGARVRMRA